MSGATITWDVTTPSGSSLVGQGPSVFTTMKSSLQSGLDAEHLWPDVGGYAGVHRAGSARVFFGTASQVSSADTDGRLMLTSDTSRLYAVPNSQTSYLIGGRFVVHHHPVHNNFGSNLTSLVTQFWATETGQCSLPNGSSSTAITLKHTYLAGAHASVQMATTTGFLAHLSTASVAGATLTLSKFLASNGASSTTGDYGLTYQVTGRVAL